MGHLLRVYKNQRGTAILDLTNTNIDAETNGSTSDEDNTPRQNTTHAKTKQERKEQIKEQQEIPAQQEHKQHIQMVETCNYIYRL